MFASSNRFSLQEGLFADLALSLGFSNPVAFAYVLLLLCFLIGAAVVYLVAYRPRGPSRPSRRAVAWAVSVAAERCGPGGAVS
jgi:hypothetical protein